MSPEPPPPDFDPREVLFDDPFSPNFNPTGFPLDFNLIDKILDQLTAWFQKWTSYDSFAIAKPIVSSFAWLNIAIIAIIAKHVLVSHNQSIICTLVTALYCICSYMEASMLVEAPALVDQLRNRVMDYIAKNGTKNPIARSFNRKIIFYEAGLLYLFYSSGLILHDESDMILKTLIVAKFPLQYVCALLTACTPNRPSKSKLRQLLDSLKEKVASATEGLGGAEPEPA